MDWRKESLVPRPEIMCAECPRRILPTRREQLLSKMGRLPIQEFDSDCSGGEAYVTTVTTNTGAEPQDRHHIVTELDCPKMYGIPATDWNISFLGGVIKRE